MIWNDALRRAVRTFIQSFIGVGMTMFLASYTTPGVLPGIEVMQRIGIAAATAGVISVLTFVQNALEDNTSTPALLKAPASSGENPIPKEGGEQRVT